MNFLHLNYLPGLLMAFAVLLVTVILLERRFFRLIKTYWFYNRSFFSYVSSLLFLCGMGVLLSSLLDARGPETRIKTPVPTDRTIILIDTSASMLAEDVKPSRLQKASLVAKHFARKAIGHQISIVVFAEIQKKIVPFTNDLDLIDSRLESIKHLKNHYGTSALTVAIQESIQYFSEGGGEPRGNLLILTDGEETAGDIGLKIPKDIHVALVGIGTEQGGRIPLDDSRGFRFGYKTNKGKEVITKLHEDFFKKITAEIPSAKYWLANSYSLPSDEIMDFFKTEKIKGKDSQDMLIRPVMMEWIVIPSLILLILSYLFKTIRIFTLGLFLCYVPVRAEEAELTPELVHRLQELQQGELNKLEKIKLADDLYKAGAKVEALSLYEENLPIDRIDHKLPPEAYLNYGTALLEKGDPLKGSAVYESLSNSLEGQPSAEKIKEMMAKNVLSYFQQQEQKKKEDKKNEEDKKDNQENKDQGKEDQKSGQSGQDQKNSQQKPSKGDEKKEDQKKKDSEKPDKGEEKKEDKGEEKKDENKDQNDGEKKPMPPKKIPAKLKQLLSDDRQLQIKMIENGTRDLNKRQSRDNKDW